MEEAASLKFSKYQFQFAGRAGGVGSPHSFITAWLLLYRPGEQCLIYCRVDCVLDEWKECDGMTGVVYEGGGVDVLYPIHYHVLYCTVH